MKAGLASAGAAFSAGVLAGFWTAPSLSFLLLSLALIFILLVIFRGKDLFRIFFLVGMIGLGLLAIHISRIRPVPFLEPDLSWEKTAIEGKVAGFSKSMRRGKRLRVTFTVALEKVLLVEGFIKKSIPVRGRVQVSVFQPDFIPDFGDSIRVWGSFKRPEETKNPGVFDYRRYLAQRNIFWMFTGKGRNALRVLEKSDPGIFLKSIHWLRGFFRDRSSRFFDPVSSSFFCALILGERSEIPGDFYSDFMKTGTSHLLAVSGLNIVLVVGGFYALLIVLGFHRPWAAGLGLAVTWVYVWIAGLDPPVVRAGWMASAVFLSLILERPHGSFSVFFITLGGMLMAEPESLQYLSFQLSFLSVFSLMLLLPSFSTPFPPLGIMVQTFAVTLLTSPLVLYYFHLFSPVSFLANFLAIPLFHLALLFVLFGLTLSCIPWVGWLLTQSGGLFLNGGIEVIRFCAAFDAGYCYLRTPGLTFFLFYYGGILLFILFKRKTAWAGNPSLSKIGMLMAASLWIFSAVIFFRPERNQAHRITFLYQAKSEAAFLQFKEGNWLINAGNRKDAEWVIGPYLRSQGVKRLDGLILQDSYQRHAGGMAVLLKDFLFDQILRSGYQSADVYSKKKDSHRTQFFYEPLQWFPEGQFWFLGATTGRLAIWVNGPLKVLMLPGLDAAFLQQLEGAKHLISEVKILYLPLVKDRRLLEKLFDLIDPEVLVTRQAPDDLKRCLRERDIRLLDLSERGAVRFEETKEGIRGDPYLRGSPFLLRS